MGDQLYESRHGQVPIDIPRDSRVDISCLLAAVAVLFYRYSGDNPVTLNLEEWFDHPADPKRVHQKAIQVDISEDSCFSALTSQLSEVLGTLTCTETRCPVPVDVSKWLAQAGESAGEDKLSLIVQNGDSVLAAVRYALDTFDERAMTSLAIHFRTLLEAALSQPDGPIVLLPMLSQTEIHQVLVEWNGSGCEMERPTIPDAFDQRVRKNPKAPALLYNGQVISYQELQVRAQKVASSLQAYSIGLETRIGVCLEDPLAVAVSYLGIVTAGAVIVPLDLDWPEERLARVAADAELRYVIVSGRGPVNFPRLNKHMLKFEALESESVALGFHAPPISSDNGAYVIFTSGSTGIPKGIVGLHRCISAANIMARPFPEDEVFALNANLTFGSAVIGIFFALLGGAAISLMPRSIAKDLPAMVRLWELTRVTRIVLVPPQIRQLLGLGAGTKARLSNVRNVTLAGSVLSPDLLPGLYEYFPQATVINAYMCLEAGSVITRWQAGPEERSRPLTIGRPLPNVRVYVLGPKLTLLPPGMRGELYVHSPDMAREYLNLPELTRERFLSNPFEPGGRLYRTGDLGRFLPDGELEYLGRVDNQVKIRGVRIELEEIEAALQKQPGVEQAAVIAEPRGGESRLIAFVCGKTGSTLSTRCLREQLGAWLPPHLVPAIFVLMAQIPLTRNGKVDKQKLPKQVISRPEIDTCYAAPGTARETSMVAIWEQELGIDGIGVNDHFLEIGGDSLIAVRIAVRLQEEFLREVPVELLFDYPTVQELVAELERPSTQLSSGRPFQLETQGDLLK